VDLHVLTGALTQIGAGPVNSAPQTPARRITWTDEAGGQWRAERVESRWQLSRWTADTWQPVGSYPSRAAAIAAAANQGGDQ
jgi:hypothetical protein